MPLVRGLDRYREVGAGKEVGNGNALEAKAHARDGLLRGRQRGAGRGSCAPAGRVHLAGFARKSACAACELDAAVDLAIAPLELHAFEQEEATAGTRYLLGPIATARKSAKPFELSGQRRLPNELSGALDRRHSIGRLQGSHDAGFFG